MPRPRTRSDDEVLDAVEEVLARRGPHALTLADVARRVGLSPATLVQRFGTRRGLLVAFARRAAKQSVEPFSARRGESPLATLRRGLRQLAGSIRDRRALRNGLAMLLEDLGDVELRALAAAQAGARERRIATLLEAAHAAGEVHAPDAAAVARLLYAAWNGALVLWALRGEGALEPHLDRVLFGWIRPRRRRRGRRGSRAPA